MLQRCTVISVMNLVSELDLPEFDYSAADFSADRYHQQLAETRQRGWLAKSPLAYIVLDHDAGEFFLRSRKTAFPGRQIAEFFGVTSGPLAEHIDANILNLGGEQHRRLRALVGPALTPRAADRWRPVMRGFLERLWAQTAAHGGCEFVAAGIDTTAGQLAHAIRLFAAHPGQWALLAAEPSLVPRAVEEVLRFEPVTPFTARICLEQVEHHDVVFPAGTIVAVCAERANRQGENGETFDITAPRQPKAAPRLLTFGAGTHYCLGANLARAELEEALAFLAPRTPGLALDGPPQLGGIEGVYGVDKLPITWSGSSR